MVELRVAFTKYLYQYSQEPNTFINGIPPRTMNEFELESVYFTVKNHVRLTWYIPVKNNQTCTHFEGLILNWYLKN